MFIRNVKGACFCISKSSTALSFQGSVNTQYVLKRWVHRPLIQKQWTLPEDLGMLDAYVPPSGNHLPSFWKKPIQRMKLGWRWFYHQIMGWFQCKLFQESIRPTKIDFKQLQTTVAKIYEKINHAYASGNTKDIALLCGSVYAETLKSQIVKRPVTLQFKWMLHRMIKPPKLVSFSHAKVGFGSDRYLAQAIYKIHSEQSLTTFLDGLEKKGSPEVLVEYYVFQYKTWVLPHKWYIWGKTTETSSDAVKIKIWKKDNNVMKTVGFK